MPIGQLDKSEAAALPKIHGVEPGISAQDERLLWPDVVRACAILAVMVIHSSVPFAYHYKTITHLNWLATDFYYAISRQCVPFFVLLSGMFLLGKSEPLRVFFAKRLKKLLIPFVFWQIFYFVWEGHLKTHHVSFKGVFPAIISTASTYHLWYLFMLVGLYLATPILRVFVQNATAIQIKYFLACWICFASLLPIWVRFGQVTDKVEAVVSIGYSGYFVLGYYLRDKKLGALGAKIAMGLIPICVAFSIISTNKLTALRGTVDEFFMQYLSPNIIVYSVCLFLLMKQIDYRRLYSKAPFLKKFIEVSSGTSFGVYLVHVCVLAYVYQMYGNLFNGQLLSVVFVAVPVLAATTFAISLGIVKLMQAIPGVRALVPGS